MVKGKDIIRPERNELIMRSVILVIALLFVISAMGCIGPPSPPPGTLVTPKVSVTVTGTVPPALPSTFRTALPQPTKAVTVLAGTGNAAKPLTTTDSGTRVFALSNSGNSNFIVQLKDTNGNLIYLLADEIGPWGGSISKPLDPGTYIIDVKANGPWIIEMQSQP